MSSVERKNIIDKLSPMQKMQYQIHYAAKFIPDATDSQITNIETAVTLPRKEGSICSELLWIETLIQDQTIETTGRYTNKEDRETAIMALREKIYNGQAKDIYPVETRSTLEEVLTQAQITSYRYREMFIENFLRTFRGDFWETVSLDEIEHALGLPAR
jgi:hypothetical protein